MISFEKEFFRSIISPQFSGSISNDHPKCSFSQGFSSHAPSWIRKNISCRADDSGCRGPRSREAKCQPFSATTPVELGLAPSSSTSASLDVEQHPQFSTAIKKYIFAPGAAPALTQPKPESDRADRAETFDSFSRLGTKPGTEAPATPAKSGPERTPTAFPKIAHPKPAIRGEERFFAPFA